MPADQLAPPPGTTPVYNSPGKDEVLLRLRDSDRRRYFQPVLVPDRHEFWILSYVGAGEVQESIASADLQSDLHALVLSRDVYFWVNQVEFPTEFGMLWGYPIDAVRKRSELEADRGLL